MFTSPSTGEVGAKHREGVSLEDSLHSKLDLSDRIDPQHPPIAAADRQGGNHAAGHDDLALSQRPPAFGPSGTRWRLLQPRGVQNRRFAWERFAASFHDPTARTESESARLRP